VQKRRLVVDNRYKHILVPLDGSELAEAALVDAVGLAGLSQAQLTALKVIPPIEEVLAADTGHPIYVDQQWASQEILALQYLHDVLHRMDCKDVQVHLVVKMGLPAETIIDYAHLQQIDLIVMATHGRSGLKRWVYGSVADKVLRGANIPTLLIRSHNGESRPESMRDTSELSETNLTPH
jgi:nucleotide-binding universal stress UspA family protein